MATSLTTDRKIGTVATKTTFSSCYMCTMNCPITVTSENDEIVSISHPDCVRATAMEEQRDSAHRLLHPMLRASAGDAWKTISWEHALADAAARLTDIRDRHGADSVAFFVGYTKETRPYFQRLAYAFGSPHYITESSCCFASAFIAAKVTLGDDYAYFFNTGRFRQTETKCRMVWSNNPADSLIPFDRHYLLQEADKVPTIVVDPRRTSLAEAAAVHLQLRPGTDGALALGLAHAIFAEGLEDADFLEKHAHGLADYKAYLREFTPARAATITGVAEDRIVAAARLYATTHPAQLTVSQEAIVQHTNGFQNHRAVVLLAAITGNLDVAGGDRPFLDILKETNVTRRAERLPMLGPQMGDKEFPVFTANYTEGQAMPLADYIESGRIKAVVSLGANVLMWPNSERVAKALRSLEFFSACDFFPNPTVDAATAFFPAATHLERQALIVGLPGKVQYRPAAVPPRGEARGDTEFLFALAEALGLKDEFWGGDIRASFEERLGNTGLAFADLPENGKTVQTDRSVLPQRGYESTGFATPSGKVEFRSTVLEEAGYDGLPTYTEPHWSPVATPEIAKDFPLVLTSGGRSNNYTHSQGRLLEILKAREPEPRLQISPTDAAARGIEDGDRIELASPLGAIAMAAWVTDIMAPGVVHAFHGWPQANANALIPDTGLDPISGYAPFKSSLCEVGKARG